MKFPRRFPPGHILFANAPETSINYPFRVSDERVLQVHKNQIKKYSALPKRIDKNISDWIGKKDYFADNQWVFPDFQ